MCLRITETRTIVDVLTNEMEYRQIIFSILTLQLIIILQKVFIKIVKTRISCIKLLLAQLWIVQEESSAEIIHCFLRLW